MGNKDKVYKDYDKIADWFDSIRMRDLRFEKKYLDMVIAHTKPAGKILDIGCGMGEPVAKYFVDHNFHVTGIDGSHKMIEKAQNYVPKAAFYVKDMRELNLPEKFDALILWHSLFHLSPNDQKMMFTRFENHLYPGGILLFTSGHEGGEIWSDNGGENLYHASLSPPEYRELLTRHHFEIIYHTIEDKDCGDTTIWLAKYGML